MALTLPGANYRPLGPQTQARLTYRDVICLHTMVGSLWGTDNYFRRNGFGGAESHFGVGHDGEILQWQDLDYRADANLYGNDHIISIETADVGEGFPDWDLNDASQVPAWTDAQLDAIAHIVRWCCDRFNIPIQLKADSRRGEQGVAYHRQGVDPYRVDGGELWSSAYAKACPGDRRIAQIPEILRRARGDNTGTAPAPAPEPATTNTNRQEHSMESHRLYRGHNKGRIICPVGTDTSALYGRGWVSVTGEGGGTINYILFQKDAAHDGPPPGAGAPWGGRIRNASRVHKQLPDRTEYIEYDIDVYGVKNANGDWTSDVDDPIGAITVELEAWK